MLLFVVVNSSVYLCTIEIKQVITIKAIET